MPLDHPMKVPIRVAMQILRDANVNITMEIYSQVSSTAMRDALTRSESRMGERALLYSAAVRAALGCVRERPQPPDLGNWWGGRDSNPRPRDYESRLDRVLRLLPGTMVSR